MTAEDEQQIETMLASRVDRYLYLVDTQYHAEVGTLRHWLMATKAAMREADLSPASIDRVIGILVATLVPDGTEARDRHARYQQELRDLGVRMPNREPRL